MLANVLTEQWLHPDNYNFWSSQFGAFAEKVLIGFIFLVVLKLLWPRVWKHFECDVEAPENCHRRGHPVSGTGHKACGEHHPHRHDRLESPTTVHDIHHHHEEAASP